MGLSRATSKMFLRLCAGTAFLGILLLIPQYFISPNRGSIFQVCSSSACSPPPSVPVTEKISTTPLCSARNNLVFARVHKCASSTLQNVFLRYGMNNDLKFALPYAGIYFGHPQIFRRSMMPFTIDPDQEFNMFVHHMRFDYQEVRLAMPPDSAFVTMFRDPVALFESLYHFGELHWYYKMDLYEFIEKAPTKLDQFLVTRYLNNQSGVNMITFDLGLDIFDFWRPKVVERFAHLLDKYFDLVLIAERFDESLILLKELMCWKLEDVTYFRLNKRTEEARTKLTENQTQKLRRINAADQLVYEYFQKRFQERVEAYGTERMKREVEDLKRLNQDLYNYCVKKEVLNRVVTRNNRTYTFHRPSLRYEVIDDKECLAMTDLEGPTSDYLRKKQQDLYWRIQT